MAGMSAVAARDGAAADGRGFCTAPTQPPTLVCVPLQLPQPASDRVGSCGATPRMPWQATAECNEGCAGHRARRPRWSLR